MLYQPTNVYPSMTGGLGNGVVDVTKPLKVSWQVNGNSAMTAYQITIYKNDSESTQVMTTSKLTNNCPFYGVDYAGNIQFFSHTISAATMASAGMTNGNEYTIKIRQWWGASDADSVTQTSANAFITRAAPTVSIKSFTTPVTEKSYSFSAVYTQGQSDALTWAQWQLARVSGSEYDIIHDTGKIYGTAELKFDYDGFFSGNSYAVRCMVQTQNGIDADSGWTEFAVSYSSESGTGTLTACQKNKVSGIQLSFQEVKDIPMFSIGTAGVGTSESFLNMPDGAWVGWSRENTVQMFLEYPFALAWRGNPNANGKILYILGKAVDQSTGETVVQELTVESITNATSEMLAMPATAYWNDVAYGNGILLAVGGNSNTGAFSTNGREWKSAGLDSQFRFDTVCYGGGKFVAGAYATETMNSKMAISISGSTWEYVTVPSFSVNDIIYANSQYVAVGADGAVFTSSNADTWTRKSTNTDNSILSVCYGNEKYVAIMNSTSIMYSTNLSTWNYASGISSYIYSICYGNGKFVASTDSGMYTSSDGIVWAKFSERKATHITFMNDLFIANTAINFIPFQYSTDGTSWTYGPTINLASSGFSQAMWHIDGEIGTIGSGNDRVSIVSLATERQLTFKTKDGTEKTISTPNGTFLSIVDDGNRISVCGGGATSIVPISANWENIMSIQMYGSQSCDYLYVSDGEIDEYALNDILSDESYHPTDQPAQFFCDFNNGETNGGNKGYAFAIYRLDSGNSNFKHIADIDSADGNIVFDCGTLTGNEYKYYAYSIKNGVYANTSIVSNAVYPCFWDWAVLSCTEKNGIFYVQRVFRFGKNLASGNISNNNSPQIIQNFTRYPTIQTAPQNYRSGSLQSLIGEIAEGKYYDTVRMQDDIYELSTTSNTLFLKNRKGELMKIRISGAITMETDDNTAAQAQTVTLPWAEIGSAENASIILTKNDAAWPY